MSYSFRSDFQRRDDAGQPYGFEVERSSSLEHLHASVRDGAYAIRAPGNKYLLLTPDIKDFTFQTGFAFAPTIFIQSAWKLFFDYDPLSRTGYAVEFLYCDSHENTWEGFHPHTLTLQIMEVSPDGEKPLQARRLEQVRLHPRTWYLAQITRNSHGLSGNFAGHAFQFELRCRPRGRRVGVGRGSFVGEIRFRDMQLYTEEEFERQTVVPCRRVTIPAIHGGAIPYTLTVGVDQYHGGNAPSILKIRLEGGMWKRQKHACHPGQYCVEMDRFARPAVTLRCGVRKWKVFLHNESLVVIDPSIHYAFLAEYFHAAAAPVALEIPVADAPGEWPPIAFSFEYDSCRCSGYRTIEGGPSEFVWDADGNLIYHGERRQSDTMALEVTSHGSSFAGELPSSLHAYASARRHAAKNHYFHGNDTPAFQWEISWPEQRYRQRYLCCEAALCDAFFQKITTLPVRATACQTQSTFPVSRFSTAVPSELLQHGVYHLEIRILYAGEVLKERYVAFEWIDPRAAAAPPVASGLPFLYSCTNEESLLESDAFDPWSSCESSNAEHYFACACFTPSVGQKKRVWEALAPYHREWYMWLDSRTESDWRLELFPEALAHADYLSHPNQLGIRGDLWKATEYIPEVLSMLKEFLDLTPEARNFRLMTPDYVASLLADCRFPSYEALQELLSGAGNPWPHFYGARLRELLLEQTRALEEHNPKLKRAQYGPWPVYTARWKSAYYLHAFGFFPDGTMQRVWQGFFQFEDYSFLCSYHTCAAAWGLMSFGLYYPGVKVYPELYDDVVGGCPDGALSFAAPPLGERHAPDYYQIAAAYEYAYATACRTESGFSYWQNYGFMFRDPRPEALANFVRAWRHVRNHPPAACLRSIGYIMDIPSEDNRLLIRRLDAHGWPEYGNYSEDALGYVNMCARLGGIPAGFGMKFATLASLRPEECSMLVLPSLVDAAPEHLGHIRRLHAAGVALLACGSVRGLEDLFSVRESPRTRYVQAIENDGSQERIFPFELELNYEAEHAETLLRTSAGDGLLFRHGRTALLNTNPAHVGHDSFYERVSFARESISVLQFEVLKALLLALNEPRLPFIAEHAGCMGFRDRNGETCMVLTDYGSFDDRRFAAGKELVTVRLQVPAQTLLCEEKTLHPLIEDGRIRGFTCRIKPREAIFLRIL